MWAGWRASESAASHFASGASRDARLGARLATRHWPHAGRVGLECGAVGEKKAVSLPDVAATAPAPRPDDVLELDEMWSFVSCKRNVQWLWLALCRRTRRIVAYWLGGRDEYAAGQFWASLPPAWQALPTYTDYWSAYPLVVPPAQHRPGGKGDGQTNHIERFNGTLRQRLARFTRKTLAFSKSEEMHELAVKLFVHHYNLSRN